MPRPRLNNSEPERHQPAPAHRSARHAHQALQTYAHALAAGLCARGDNGGKRRRLFEQFLDGFLGRLALDEIANQGDGLAGDVRAQVRGGRDAGYQVLHFTLLGRAEKTRGVGCLAARVAEIKRASNHSTSSAFGAKWRCRHWRGPGRGL